MNDAVPSRKQLDAVQRIITVQHISHYAVLRVQESASTDDILRAYKYAAFAVHPDKNSASDANRAFQILGQAKDVLIDDARRRKYDTERLLKQQEQQAHLRRQADLNNHQPNPQADTPEGFTIPRRVYEEPRWTYYNLTPSSDSSILIVLGVVIAFGAIYIAALFGLSTALPIKFRLQPDETFKIPRKTFRLSISYYVTKNFRKLQSHLRESVDNDVEELYLAELEKNCTAEQYRKENSPEDWIFCTPKGTCGMREHMKTRSCDELKNNNDILKKHNDVLSKLKKRTT